MGPEAQGQEVGQLETITKVLFSLIFSPKMLYYVMFYVTEKLIIPDILLMQSELNRTTQLHTCKVFHFEVSLSKNNGNKRRSLMPAEAVWNHGNCWIYF